MNKSYGSWFASILFLMAVPRTANAQDTGKQLLRLVQTIPMPNVKGRLDHMDVDIKGKRLFVAGLENGTLEVVDLQSGKRIRSLGGFQKPQGALYVEELNKLFVASGDDAMLRVFKGDTLDLLDSIQLEPGPNRVVYDPHTKLVYVGYGGKDAGKDYGEVGIIDARNDKRVGDIKVAAHPSELLLNKLGTTLFVFISIANQLQVVDTNKRLVVSAWKVSSEHPGDAAFDESNSRLMIGTRTPPEMIVMDSQSGKEVAHRATAEGMDGVYFDSQRKRIYVSGGRELPAGFAYVYQQKDADHYDSVGKIPTRAGAGTSFWSPALDRYYVAAPANGKQDAAILVYRPLPIRIAVGYSTYHDSHGNVWMPDRYFFGGRLSRFVGDLSKTPDGGLYEWHRFGHFHYVIPVAPGGKYTLKLYFLEHWFGIQNGGIGGVGSRVFDVYCNGSTLLKGFDIFSESGSGPLVKAFQHIEPTPQGKIEIYFTPAVNYPSISAIEVIPE